jgi:hypothetical protein
MTNLFHLTLTSVRFMFVDRRRLHPIPVTVNYSRKLYESQALNAAATERSFWLRYVNAYVIQKYRLHPNTYFAALL